MIIWDETMSFTHNKIYYIKVLFELFLFLEDNNCNPFPQTVMVV